MKMDKEILSGCCSLQEICNFGWGYYENLDIEDKQVANVATTIPGQRNAVAYLKRSGFKKLRSWKSINTGNKVTLWFRKPSKK